MLNIHGLQDFLAIWKNAQKPMLDEKRWGNFPVYNQTLVEHANSFPLVGRLVMSVAARPMDTLLFTDCVMLHDHGEPRSGGDEHAGNKTKGKDVREWIEFRNLIAKLPPTLRQQWMRAFSLQYVRKSMWEDLPPSGIALVTELRQTHSYEAGLFDFSERLDYVCSAYAGYERGVRNQKETMIEHTIGNQSEKLDALVEEFPELGSLWSIELKTQLWNLC